MMRIGDQSILPRSTRLMMAGRGMVIATGQFFAALRSRITSFSNYLVFARPLVAASERQEGET